MANDLQGSKELTRAFRLTQILQGCLWRTTTPERGSAGPRRGVGSEKECFARPVTSFGDLTEYAQTPYNPRHSPQSLRSYS